MKLTKAEKKQAKKLEQQKVILEQEAKAKALETMISDMVNGYKADKKNTTKLGTFKKPDQRTIDNWTYVLKCSNLIGSNDRDITSEVIKEKFKAKKLFGKGFKYTCKPLENVRGATVKACGLEVNNSEVYLIGGLYWFKCENGNMGVTEGNIVINEAKVSDYYKGTLHVTTEGEKTKTMTVELFEEMHKIATSKKVAVK